MTDDRGIRRWAIGAGLVGGVAVAAAVVAAGAASADDNVIDFNGWTVDLHQVAPPEFPITGVSPATLSDPSDSLGVGHQVAGTFVFGVPTAIGSEFDGTFIASPYPVTGEEIRDWWFPAVFETVSNNIFGHGVTEGIFVPDAGGTEVVDVLNWGTGSAPLINPDATGPVEVGGVDLASPHDGALLNDVFDVIVTGDTADWGKAATLFGDLLGADPSTATDTVDPGSFIG